MKSDKQTIIDALYRWVAQRPGLEYANYGNGPAYRAELRQITRQRHDAEAMIRYCAYRDSIEAEDLRQALSRGRLTWTPSGLEYCTGQYWPTEYRAAVCRQLSSLLWDRFREDREPECRAEDIRAAAKRELGAPIARRWFA